MALGFLHHFGTFLIFGASILLLVVTISAPVIHDISMVNVVLTNQSDIRNSSVTFGTFGYCVLDVAPIETDQDYCSGRHIGYRPADLMAKIDGTDFSNASQNTANGLTKTMILHPIACVLAFVAFLLALGSGIIGALTGTVVAFLAWVITLVAMAIDFTWAGIVRNHVNKDGTGSHAKFGVGIWLILAAMVALFFGMIITFLTCCAKRREKRRSRVTTTKEAYATGPTTRRTTKRRFWQRRSKY